MFRMLTYVVAMVLAVFALAGCRESAKKDDETASDVQIELQTESTAIGDTVLLVTLKNADGSLITDAVVTVKGDMGHAGMVPVLGAADRADDNGVYRMPFEWTMGGEWVVTVSAVLADEKTVTKDFHLDISAEGSSMNMETTEEASGAINTVFGDLGELSPVDCADETPSPDETASEDCSLPPTNTGLFPPLGGG